MRSLLKEKLIIIITVTFSMSFLVIVNGNVLYAQTNNTTQNDSETSFSSKTLTGSSTIPEAISIPVSKGYVDGNVSYFISTDASEKNVVSSVSNSTKFEINYAPSLANTSESSRQQGYVFINGIKGEGSSGFQLPVASATPGDEGYSPLFEINYVKWNDESNSRILKTADEVLGAQNNGELTITKSNIVINSPFVQIK
jgi:hypothetical protein